MNQDAFAALRELRQRQIDAGLLEVGVLKDAHLHQIIRADRRAAADIERMLPRTAKSLAADIAAVMVTHASVAAESDAVPTTPAAATAARTDSVSDELLELGADDFCEFEHDASDLVPGPLAITRQPGGGHRIEWEPGMAPAGPTVLYRVVANEGHRAYKPEAGRLVGVTQGLRVVDTAPPASAVRYVQVWCHAGTDIRDAAQRQPVLIAEGQILSPVVDVLVQEDDGTVIGQWSAWPGTSRVRVLRIPLDGLATADADTRHRILATEPNIGGFVDTAAERGRRYLYRAIGEVEVDGRTLLSPPAEAEVAVSVVLEAVTDLAVHTHGAGADTRFDLEWTAPTAGTVRMYRTEAAPKPGLGYEALAEAALEVSGGLPASARLVHPVVPGADGVRRMTNVSWPRGWVRAYFTPVTVLDDKVQVGTTVAATRPLPAVCDVRIIERNSEQVLTFPWPAGAALVSVHLSQREVPAHQVVDQRPEAEISRSLYERDGGLHLPKPLPAHGCSVHVVPVAYTAGERIVGVPTTVDYPGLLRIWYDVTAQAGGTAVAIRLASEVETNTAPPFMLVHNESRLPLSKRDGHPLEVRSSHVPQESAARSFHPQRLGGVNDESWIADVSNLTGYIRVFADVDPEKGKLIALLDPRIDRIRLDLLGGQEQ
ncbi:hypothetical protein [Prescottella equi]|uniref:Uncharacterized protein n=1 Tax=Prescottella equi ATCC 33707 TaxID=525370 RepID=E9SXQ1_RHOHA|nr:hypothetical protein [Prescottella equi]EGD25335.1 hypothetical protein HMPREF0724_11116 [Prescottella equi ATCC 33707]